MIRLSARHALTQKQLSCFGMLLQCAESITAMRVQMVPQETRCIPGGMDTRRLGSLLRQYDGVRVLHLGDAPRMWGGWHDASVSYVEMRCNCISLTDISMPCSNRTAELLLPRQRLNVYAFQWHFAMPSCTALCSSGAS